MCCIYQHGSFSFWTLHTVITMTKYLIVSNDATEVQVDDVKFTLSIGWNRFVQFYFFFQPHAVMKSSVSVYEQVTIVYWRSFI